MGARKPVVAGQFYGGTRQECLAELEECLPKGKLETELPGCIVGGIVPHAGWVFSGKLAGLVFAAVKQTCRNVDTFVIFGAMHRYPGNKAAVYDKGSWLTPLGEAAVDHELAGQIAGSNFARADTDFHSTEHSIEVQVPFIQYLFEGARIVPVMVPPTDIAVDLGREVGLAISQITDKRIVCIASTDLTHYGPRYGFCPAGSGESGIKWAKEVNDMDFINLALRMEGRKVLLSAIENSNACGPGASAALIESAKVMGRDKGVLLAHTHSCDVMRERFGQSSEESVGYAAIVY